MKSNGMPFVLAVAGLVLFGHRAAAAGNEACDRACLTGLADQLLDSMVAHDASKLPLTPAYAATENSVPAVPNMMVAWRTASAAEGQFYVVDPVSHQVLVLATLVEGSQDTLLWGRIRAQGGMISELEVFENRSRGQGGFQYSGAVLTNMPSEWTRLGRTLRPAPQFDALPVEIRELGPSYRASDPEGTKRWLEIYRASQPTQPLPRRALRNFITLSALATIRLPTLLITGDADLDAPPPVQEQFHARIKKSKAVVITGAGHSAYWERPDQFNRTVLSFLEKH